MRNSTGPSRAVLAAAVAVAATWAVLPQPAFAASAGDWATLSAAFANPAGVGGQVELGADLTQGAAVDLRLADGAALVLDLNGHDLTTATVGLGAGSTLTVTDSTTAPGTFTAAPPPTDGAGIALNGATLVVRGRAVVNATARRPAAAGIGGDQNHLAGGTVTITDQARVSAAGGQFAAAIGGADHGAGGSVTIGGSATVTAKATDGAGIGGGDYSSGGTIRITGSATVTASSSGGAGIGGGYWGGNGGEITIDGAATVNATSTLRGAGIGGGQAALGTPSVGGEGGTVLIAGTAHVTATGSSLGAGIGGGTEGAGGTVTVRDDPTVTATSPDRGAGIGGGVRGAGGSVVLDGGTVTAGNSAARDSSAVGQGALATDFGSLAVNAPAMLVIPDGAVLRVPQGVTVTGDGSLHSGGAGTRTGGGPLRAAGDGPVVNDGAIQLPTDNVQWERLGVLPNNFLITFDANGGAPTEAVRVFATSFAAGARTVPAPPTRAGFAFEGWNTAADGSGQNVEIGPDTPLDADRTLYAQWAADTATTLVPRGTPGRASTCPSTSGSPPPTRSRAPRPAPSPCTRTAPPSAPRPWMRTGGPS
ncbi:InlB B-repeat-containing protein [Kitasatospora saccharophila]|uniref:InlB B-repeat-containing protein n=1 Tax=Kitasatospora saccharophila TaxID=407973 RepID=UPI00363EF627